METSRHVSTIAILLLMGTQLSCKKDEPIQPHTTSIELSVEDASCTEAWLKVSLLDASQPRTVAVQQDGQRVLTAQMTTADSVFVVEGLLPGHTYSYVAQRLRDTSVIDVSSPVQATTMNTTSHDITWQQVETLGDGNSSTLWDVAIINDTLAYAVGEIYLRDSTGQFDPMPYNMAKWNGRTWALQRLTYAGYPSPIRFVYALAQNDIWFGIGYLIHWNGSTYQEVQVPVLYGVRSVKMWCNPSGNIYVVGDNGIIVCSADRGASWQRVESGTAVPLNDVWGGSNRIAGENIVLMTGSDDFTLSERKILRLKADGTIDSLTWGTIYRIPESVWFDRSSVFVCGDGLFELDQDGRWRDLQVPLIFLRSVRGTAANDLIAVGEFGFVIHHNGLSFREYAETRLLTGNYKSVAVTLHRIIAVGRSGSTAVALVGTR